MRFLQGLLTLNQSFAAVHLVGRGRPTKTTKELRRRRRGRWNSRVVHVVQRSNRNMAGAYDGPPKFLLRGRGERGERGPVSPSRTSRLCIACIARYGRMTRSQLLGTVFYSTRTWTTPSSLPFQESSSVENFFYDTVFSDHHICIYIYIPWLVFRRGETARYGYPQTED